MAYVPTSTFEISQGATLWVPFAVYIDGNPAALSGAGFKSTVKLDPNLPDDDPSVIKIDWTGESNPNRCARSFSIS